MAEDNKKPEKAAKKKKARKNPFKSIASFFKSVNSERKKVVWPTAKETLKNAAIVLVVTVIVGVAIYIIDAGLSLGLKGIKNLAPTTTTTSVSDSTGSTQENAGGTTQSSSSTSGTSQSNSSTSNTTQSSSSTSGTSQNSSSTSNSTQSSSSTSGASENTAE